jgi:hypothetical protein
MGYWHGNTILNPSAEIKLGTALKMLKSHPNYKDQQPYKGEGLVAYTLRCAAHLVSPPQFEGESYDVECTDIASGILSLEEEITKRWKEFNNV